MYIYILISSSFPGSFVCSTHLPLLIKTFTSSSKSILGSCAFCGVIYGDEVEEDCSFPNESSSGAL